MESSSESWDDESSEESLVSDVSSEQSGEDSEGSDVNSDESDASDVSSEQSEPSSEESETSQSSLSSLSSSSSCHENVALHLVQFSEGHRISRDADGVLYPTPEWKDNTTPPDGDNLDKTDHRSPYLYVQEKRLKIAEAKWKLLPGSHISPRRNIFVRGFGPDGIAIPETIASVDRAGGWISISNVTATSAFPGSTKYYPEFAITWEMRCTGEPWMGVGSSKHIIYVCLAEPEVTLFRTIVHLACSNEGATTSDEAVRKTWDLLKGPENWKGWNESAETWSRRLFYYRNSTRFSANGDGATMWLLRNRQDSGQCSTWVSLMQDALKLNGVASARIWVRHVIFKFGFAEDKEELHHFLIKNWSYGDISFGGGAAYPYFFEFAGGPERDMIPRPAGGNYGDLTSTTGIPGQNAPTPSQKVFFLHVILKYTFADTGETTYFDPSYGETYLHEGEFQAKAVAGFAMEVDAAPYGHARLHVRKPSTTTEIAFKPPDPS